MSVTYLLDIFIKIQRSAPMIIFLLSLLVLSTLYTSRPLARTKGAAHQQTNRAASQSAPRGKSTVRGRIVFDDTERPVRRARITLFDPNDAGKSRIATADRRGEFQIKNVAAGHYYMMVIAPGVITSTGFLDFDDNAASERLGLAEMKEGLNEVTVNGTSDVEVKVSARRGGVITGKVRYSDGDPASGAQISVWRKKDGRTTRLINFRGDSMNGLRADDRGVYRVAGLPSGEYLVSAAEEDNPLTDENGEGGQVIYQEGRASLVVTYYPSASKAQNATPVRVDAGKETGNIDVTLADRRTHKLAGTVTSQRDGQPVADAMVSIQDIDEGGAALPFFGGGQTTGTDKQGRWSFGEVPEGTYVISVEPRFSPPPEAKEGEPALGPSLSPSRPGFAAKRQEVTVGDADLTDMKIELPAGRRISGTVVVDGGGPFPQRVYVSPRMLGGERPSMFSARAFVDPNGKWAIDGVPPGDVHLVASITPENKYYTKSATVNGQDVSHEPLRVTEDADVTGVRILISPDVATLSGHVIAADHKPVGSGGIVALVPADPNRWRFTDEYLFGTTNIDGGFAVGGAPGEYLVIARGPGDMAPLLNEYYISSRAAKAPRVTLKSGERKSIDVVVEGGK